MKSQLLLTMVVCWIVACPVCKLHAGIVAPAIIAPVSAGLGALIADIFLSDPPDFSSGTYTGTGTGVTPDGHECLLLLYATIPHAAPLYVPEGDDTYVYSYDCSAALKYTSGDGEVLAPGTLYAWHNTECHDHVGSSVTFCGSASSERTVRTTCDASGMAACLSVSAPTDLRVGWQEYLDLKANQFRRWFIPAL